MKNGYKISEVKNLCRHKRSLKGNQDFRGWGFHHYPSSSCVNGAKSFECGVLIEVLGYREAQKDREAQNEFDSEAVEIAELQET